jgi:DNA helicase-2/ATP-dependent DNA helicase PcrA
VMQKENWHEIANMVNTEMSGFYDVSDGVLAHGTKEGDRFLFYYGLAHARMVPWQKIVDQLPPVDRWDIDQPKFEYFCATLEKYKRETGLLDFNDMLEQGEVTGAIPRLKVAIIDEAQDLSLRQWKAVYSLFANCERVIVAGDDDQAIFEWSGADVNTFLKLKGTRSVLDRSYRLPQRIFNFADNIVSRVRERYPKDWSPDYRAGSVQTIAELSPLREIISENDGKSWMLLARNKYLMNDHVAMLKAWGVPVAVKNKTAFDPKDLRMIQSYELLRSGKVIDTAEVQAIYNKLRGNYQIKRGFKMLPPEMPERVNWDYLAANAGLDPGNWMRESAWFDLTPSGASMFTDMSHEKVSYYRAIRRAGYHTSDEAKVDCNTIHGVKGGEADNVILLDGMAPRTMREFEENPDPEHRVWYVGASRARENLFVLKSAGTQNYPL